MKPGRGTNIRATGQASAARKHVHLVLEGKVEFSAEDMVSVVPGSIFWKNCPEKVNVVGVRARWRLRQARSTGVVDRPDVTEILRPEESTRSELDPYPKRDSWGPQISRDSGQWFPGAAGVTSFVIPVPTEVG